MTDTPPTKTLQDDISPAAFRRALGQFASGVGVITAKAPDGQAVGVTVSSFNSVSLTPPLVLFSIDRKALSLSALQAARSYAVNILRRGQEQLSSQFAKSLADKWGAVEHTLGHGEAPLLANALAQFECVPYANYDGGDHVIFVGRVVRFSYDPTGAPLVFFRGAYRGLEDAELRPA